MGGSLLLLAALKVKQGIGGSAVSYPSGVKPTGDMGECCKLPQWGQANRGYGGSAVSYPSGVKPMGSAVSYPSGVKPTGDMGGVL